MEESGRRSSGCYFQIWATQQSPSCVAQHGHHTALAIVSTIPDRPFIKKTLAFLLHSVQQRGPPAPAKTFHRHVSPFPDIFTCTGIKSIHASLFLALARHDHFFISFPYSAL